MKRAYVKALLWIVVSSAWLPVWGEALPDGVAVYWGAERPADIWRDSSWLQGGTGRIHFDNEIRKHGVGSVRLEGVNGETTAIGTDVMPAAVDNAGAYVLHFWARLTGDPHATVNARVFTAAHEFEQRCRPIGWATFADGTASLPIPPSPNWQSFSAPLGPLPGSADRLVITFGVTGAATLWLDEIALAKAGVDVPLGGQAQLTDADYAGIRFEDQTLPENLLRNAGFEDTGLAPWEFLGDDTKAELDRSRAHTGQAALRIDAKEFTSGYVWQRVDIDPRRRYRLGLQASCNGLVGYLFTKVLPFNRHGQPTGWVGDEILVTGTTAWWVERSTQFSVPPGTANLVVYVRVEDTIGQVWVDDVVLQPLPLAAETGADP